MNNITITGHQDFMEKNIPVVLGGFGKDKKSLTDKTIAEIHNQPVYEIRRRINDNIARFNDCIDLVDLKQRMGESQTLKLLQNLGYAKQSITQAEHIYILSERGYAKLIKIMDSDLAWEIHDKLIDEYFQLREEVSTDKMSTELKAIVMLDKKMMQVEEKISDVEKDLQTFKAEIPILGIEENKITKAVRIKGVDCLGGKKANAYKSKSLRQKVYTDIHMQLRREFGVTTYKAIKRNECEKAIEIIKSYKVPFVLKEQIKDTNNQMNFKVM